MDKTEDSEIKEISVKAHVRIIHRKIYSKACQCDEAPGIITAPVAPRLIPKSAIGISLWVEILLNKFLYSRATNNLCNDYLNRGLPIAPGTIAGGLQHISGLFESLIEQFIKKQLTEQLFHNDETGWKVFETIEGKVGYRWYLWVIRSQSVVYYIMAPGRSGDIPIEYFSQLDKTLTQVVVVCDRYSGYKRLARVNSTILLAFCWAHVRRDFIDAARSWPKLELWMFSWADKISELYHINNERLKHWNAELAFEDQSKVFVELHQALVLSLKQLRDECDSELKKETLSKAQRKVLISLQNHWLGLTVFVKKSEVPMDNNKGEQSMRPPVTGRKNYYGSGSQWSADLAAMMFSVFQTLRLWGINPHHWMTHFLTVCAENKGQAPSDLNPFLPWKMTEKRKQQLAKLLPCQTPESINPPQAP